jgi:hypothetical protein
MVVAAVGGGGSSPGRPTVGCTTAGALTILLAIDKHSYIVIHVHGWSQGGPGACGGGGLMASFFSI